jgi:hypothetical protein
MHRWEKFRRLSRREKWLLFRIALLLPWIGLSLRGSGFQRTQQRLTHFIPPRPIRRDLAPAALGHVVNGAGLVLGPGSCLRRALALWWLLRRRGYMPVIRYGVRRDRSGSLAHAWVELDGVVLNDAPDIAARCAVLEHPAAGRRPHAATP